MKKFSNEDLSRWKREINPAPIVQTRVPSLRRENSEWVGCCPDAFHRTKLGKSDIHPSLKFYKTEDGTWMFQCFSCEAMGNLFQFVQKVDGIAFAAAVERVLTEAGVSGWQDGAQQAEPAISDPVDQKAVVTFPMAHYAPTMVALERSPEAQKWLSDRGIGIEVARKLCLGFVQSADRITNRNLWMTDGWILFPTLTADKKTITAVKYRSLVSKKADGNSGILRAPDTSTTLYNFLNSDLTDDVWIVEGEPDTAVMVQVGLTTVGYPMGGYEPSEDECETLSKAKRRFLAGDNDKLGIKAMDALQKRLRGAIYRIVWPNNRKDANDVLTNECGNNPAKFKALVEDLKERATQTEPLLIMRRASDIVPKRINWLWKDRIPLGKITLFAGNPDNGKSLASTSVAAICTRGENFPDSDTNPKPSDVLMLIGEDDPDDTAVPRLIAARANLDYIQFPEAVRPAKQDNREIRLDFDIPALEHSLEKNPNIRLLVIDPISNYLGDINMMAEQEVRSLLVPLKRMAEKYNIAVVIVMHLNKKSELDAISRVGGAMAFIGVARCSWLFVRDVKEDESGVEGVIPTTEKKPDSFSMLRIKNNLVSSSRAGLAYHISAREVMIEGKPEFTPYVVWGDIISASADDALGSGRRKTESGEHRGVGRPNVKLQAAVSWLETALQDGLPHPTKVLRESASGGANITKDTLDRAWESIGAKSEKVKGVWCWKLDPMQETGPADDCEPQQSSLIEVEGEK